MFEFEKLGDCASSKTTEFGGKRFQSIINDKDLCLYNYIQCSKIYDVLEIEDYRCQVPLSNDSMDLCPLGMVVNFNCKSQVKLDKLDLQPPSPMVIILSDNGLLITYFVINLDSSNASICIPPSKMQFKSIPSMQQSMDIMLI